MHVPLLRCRPPRPPAGDAWSPLLRFAAGVGRRLVPWLVPLALIAVWQAASAWGWLSTRVLPAPLDVLRAAQALAESGELLKHVQVSAGRALGGLAIGGGLGLALGLLTGSLRWAETLLDSTIQMVRNIPALALIPLVILWFGIDERQAVPDQRVGVLSHLPEHLPRHTQCGPRADRDGAQLRPHALAAVPRGHPAGRAVLHPGGPAFSLGLMWVILIVAETISAQSGIGYLTMNAREFLQTDVVLVGILLYALLGKLADWFARALEHWWLRWHPGYQPK